MIASNFINWWEIWEVACILQESSCFMSSNLCQPFMSATVLWKCTVTKFIDWSQHFNTKTSTYPFVTAYLYSTLYSKEADKGVRTDG